MESPRENPYLPDKVPIYAESYISAFIHLGLASRVCNSAFSLVPTKKVDKTPYELGNQKFLDLLKILNEPCGISKAVGLMLHPHLVLGEAAFILGIKIYRDRSKRLIGLCQNAYMDKILKRYKMDNSKRGHIPMQERLDLNKSQGAQTPKERPLTPDVCFAAKYDEKQADSTESRLNPQQDCCEKHSRYVFVLNEAQWIGKLSSKVLLQCPATEIGIHSCNLQLP
ncbi:hypothetical protein Tco_1501009 [Tanacetum coccineum]